MVFKIITQYQIITTRISTQRDPFAFSDNTCIIVTSFPVNSPSYSCTVEIPSVDAGACMSPKLVHTDWRNPWREILAMFSEQHESIQVLELPWSTFKEKLIYQTQDKLERHQQKPGGMRRSGCDVKGRLSSPRSTLQANCSIMHQFLEEIERQQILNHSRHSDY